MQLYLVFPLLRRLLRATAGRHRLLLAAAVVYQLIAYAILPDLISQPDALLVSYLGFVVVGGVAAVHAAEFLDWTRRHRRAVLVTAAVTIGAGLAWFALQAAGWHDDPTAASAVFQPFIVVESIAIAWAFLALGMSWHRPVFKAGADVSFGVYLAHPLLLQGLLVAGLGDLVAGLPQPLITLLALAVVVPAAYLICAVVVAALRRTPLSLALTGHRLVGGSR
jgi:peptidoglycan/LPS O-acetylase OafA/YrhL